MTRVFSIYLPVVLFVLVVILVSSNAELVLALQAHFDQAGLAGYGAYVLLLVSATVLAPITVMPLIPLATSVFGPFITSVLSIIGWTIGACIAFFVARYIGRPVVERFVSLEKVDALLTQLPQKTRLVTIILIRMTIPVDIGSYALGLAKGITFLEYFIGTVIGVIWFSFAFAYLGDSLLTGNIPIFIEIAGASVLIFIVGWYKLHRTLHNN